MTATVYPRTHLLGLAREIRDLIYQHYVIVDGGYVHNFESGKLRTAEGGPIDLCLMLACKQVACEMQGVPLGANTITFTTGYSDASRELAGHFRFAIEFLDQFKVRTLAAGRDCITSTTIHHVTQHHPQFAPILDLLLAGQEARNFTHTTWGETPSVYRDFIACTLELVSQHPDFSRVASSQDALSHTKVADILHLRISLWTIPTQTEVTSILRKLNVEPKRPFYWYREKYRFSAATTAIHFLRSLSVRIRPKLRNIILEEDHVAVAHAECHSHGLIPFCQDNRELRIEQRVNLWRNAFIQGSAPAFAVVGSSPSFLQQMNCDRLNAWQISNSIKPWLMEAIALPRLGMPPGSFALVLDGSPALGLAAEIFDVLHRDAAWQAALDECFNRGYLATTWMARRKDRWYRCENFPAILSDIVNNKSIVRCNFDSGQLWDVENIAQANRRFNSEDWADAWRQQQPRSFQTIAPLPEWLDLRREDALPDDTIS